MQAVIIAVPSAHERVLQARIAKLGCQPTGFADRVVLVHHDGNVFIARDDNVPNELEPDRWAAFAAVAAPLFYVVDFSNITLLRHVLEVIADDPQLVVDNDCGTALPGPDFVRLLRERPDWDWRRRL